MNQPCTRRNLTWVLFFHNAKTEKFPSRLKKKRERKNTPICGETPNTLGCCANADYLIYAIEVAKLLHVALHSAITRWSQYILPPNPRYGGKARSKKRVSVMRLKTGLFRQHPNGCTQIAPAKCHLPNVMSHACHQRLCDLSQGHTISLGFF